MPNGYIIHYGTPRHSGRYPWGSGKDPYQRNSEFLKTVRDYRRNGMSDKEISEAIGMPIKDFRARMALANEEKTAADRAMVYRLREKGMSKAAIAERVGVSEGTVRNWLNDTETVRVSKTENIANELKKEVDDKTYIDVGLGTNAYLGCSKEMLRNSLQKLKDEGYHVYPIKIKQVSNGKDETLQVLTKPEITFNETMKNRDQIGLISVIDMPEVDAKTTLGLDPDTLNVAVDINRIKINYGDQTGDQKDGTIELRRGVEDLSLGGDVYTQVRIPVQDENGEKYYLKGMALYSDNMPPGKDIIFNTSHKSNEPIKDVIKPVKDDPENPFKSTVRQKYYIDSETGEKKLSAINIVREEGEWDTWSKTIASQFLSKQPLDTAKKQLKLSIDIENERFDEINSLTNPVIRKKLLMEYGDECDTKAENLKAAAFPGQVSRIILPIPSMKDNEVYDEDFKNGEKVILIRYPHAGPFEIPMLTVNNRQEEAKRVLGGGKDAIGINANVAKKLSGADFDGDTVVVIPIRNQNFKVTPMLEKLKDFDPHEEYKGYEGMKILSEKNKQKEMGKISNLITDMTIQGASEDELARAVKHSMVVIDAHKHELDYKRSYEENKIAELKELYQKKPDGTHGAHTLISKAKSERRINEVELRKYKDGGPIDPETGEYVYVETGRTYSKYKINPETGKKEPYGEPMRYQTKTTAMAIAKDARELSTGTKMEDLYAEYANELKALGNKARKTALEVPTSTQNSQAAELYSNEVQSLRAKYKTSLLNKPRERRAQLIAGKVVSNAKYNNPDIDDDDLKKIKTQAINEARRRTGAQRYKWELTSKEWEAIQAGALPHQMLVDIFDSMDSETLVKLAMPKTSTGMSESQRSMAKTMISRGYTYKEVADRFGVSPSTIKENID